ncbi:MAG: Zn-dependent alcohol dehydrogenase [Armatimonadetes bacterium]|nr:Zn-dependent alcohol dehydrogenase [Armatimonadota bacterium]
MKAAVCYEFGQPLVVEEVHLDPPQRGEVKVRLAATAICHSDIHLIRGEWARDLPVVAGHEAAGVIEEAGQGVTLAAPGDPVVVSLLRSCGRCFFCTGGSPHLCETQFPYDTEGRLRNLRGEPLRHGLRTAAFAECVIVHESQVVPVPADLPLDRAALLACGVITGVGAVINTAKVEPSQSVVVIGTGGVGLNAVQGAALSGASPIIAVDVAEARLGAARAFGATHALNARREDLAAAVKDLTWGRGADYAFVTVGNPAAVEQSLRLVRTEGTVVIVGMPAATATAALPVRRLAVLGQRIVGSMMGSTRLRIDVPRLLALYRQGRLKLDEMISARYPLERINEAIEATERGEGLRNMIVFATPDEERAPARDEGWVPMRGVRP